MQAHHLAKEQESNSFNRFFVYPPVRHRKRFWIIASYLKPIYRLRIFK